MRAFAASDDDNGPEQDDDTEDGPTPLSDEEFEALGNAIRSERADAPTDQPGEPVIARALPTPDDHPMTLFVRAIERRFGGPRLP